MTSTGTVKWFNQAKGYGYIRPDAGGPDLLVDLPALQAANLPTLDEGDRVSFIIMRGITGPVAALIPPEENP